jgi:hypothetical protein
MIYSSYPLIAATGAAGGFERDWPLPRSGQRLGSALASAVATTMPAQDTSSTRRIFILFSTN